MKSGSHAKKSEASHSRKWSAHVTESSDVLDLEKDVFKKDSAKAIATSLKKSAEHSKRKKGTPYQSRGQKSSFKSKENPGECKRSAAIVI